MVSDKIGHDMEGFLQQHSHLPRSFLLQILDSLWEDLAFEAARSLNSGGTLSECSSEAQVVWGLIDPALQEEICAFLMAKQSEQAHSAQLMDELDTPCAEIFTISKEAHVVRPLCVLLGYLTVGNIDFISAEDTVGNQVQYEGTTGSMQLLHACPDVGNISKYQFLFTRDHRAVSYRRYFFSKFCTQCDFN